MIRINPHGPLRKAEIPLEASPLAPFDDAQHVMYRHYV